MGFALLAIWALSPLGGQSALRLLSIEQGVIESTQTVFYTTGNDTSTELRESAMVAYYSASLLSATQTKDTPTDIWDNPKIPPLDTLGSIDDHGWRAVLNTSRTLYSSLVGVKLQGLCSDCNATFQIEASYLNTTCHDVSHFSTAEHNVTEIFVPANDTHWHVPERLNYNFTAHAGQVDQTLSMSSFIASRTDFADDTIDDVATILFIARGFAKLSETYSVFNCTLQEPKVEAEIKCTGSHCGVTRMRNIFRDTRWTPFHTAPQRVEDFFYKFPFAAGYTSRDQRSATDSFIFGDEASFKYARLPDWRKISLDDVSRRFSMVLNSLKQVSITPWAISNNYTVYTDPACGGVMLESAGNCKNMASTTATITRSTELYRASRLWIALLLISSLVLLVLGFMNIVLEPLCVAPDLLGYVSSMTRDNPYVDIPPGATALGGSRRARALKNIKVQISDVREDGDVGYIALRSISDEFDISKRRKFGRYRLYE